MRWSELDLPRRTWLIPGERTKNARPHLVMLSGQMVEIIESRTRDNGRDFVFGAGKGAFSGWSRSKDRLDRRCKLAAPWAVHDLRRSFVTHLNEFGIAPSVIEAIVNHASGVKAGVAGTYDRSKHLPERARVMQLWADHLTAEPTDNVVDFAPAAAR